MQALIVSNHAITGNKFMFFRAVYFFYPGQENLCLVLINLMLACISTELVYYHLEVIEHLSALLRELVAQSKLPRVDHQLCLQQ